MLPKHKYTFFVLCIWALLFFHTSWAQTNQYNSKVYGLLYGTLFGDALGGPIEFQGSEYINKTPFPIKIWSSDDTISQYEINKLKERIILRPYSHLRPYPEHYAQWAYNAPPGTITDDSRNKIVLMHALRKKAKKHNKQLSEKDMAKAYLEWLTPALNKSQNLYDSLNKDWTYEITLAARWVLGIRDSTSAPPERMWNSLPTCWGQMTNTPLASLYPGDTTAAYLLAYNISFYDHAFARDANAALVAGIAKALTLDASSLSHKDIWMKIISSIRNTDPYNYKKVPWSRRGINQYLDLADSLVIHSQQKPYLLFEKLNQKFADNEKWEAQVVITVLFSILQMCEYDPLASMQMSIEWGWDTDTYPQLLGAFIGAIYGESIFKKEWKDLIKQRLWLDYNEDIDEWHKILALLKKAGEKKKLWKER
ncbi:MAG: ADP-ribosylglycohydrolase [Bacteroidota bacterium]|jgi:ADP-ribosylglycohydrolase